MMRALLMGGAASLLGGGAYLAGAFEGGEYYPMAPNAVEARLASLQFGSELSAGGGDEVDSIRLALRSRGPSLVRWDLTMNGQKAGEVRANLSPEDSGTRVAVSFQFTDGEGMMGMESDPFINEVARIAMEEKVDSALDGRAFNADIVHAKMAAAVAANPGAVADMQKNLQENVAKELREIESDPAFDSGYQAPPRAGKPRKAPNFEESHADGGWGKN